MSEAQTFKQFSGNLSQPDWWRGGVVYQIYPRSYQDSNGDGIGDLNGISQALPHISSLGGEESWLSPSFKPPMTDFGYDVSDYCAVDPMFGTLDDFTTMLEQAHQLGLRVMIDQVLSHTADNHPWFTESRASKDNPKADWYVWADAKGDGTPPNNWLSIFGGSGWQWDTAREQYYLHNFLTSQPDLNVHHPQVQQALLDAMRFWLELGVDGFRFDTVNFYMHDPLLRDNPPRGRPQGIDGAVNSVNPYAWQWHQYDKTQPENIPFLKKIRAMLDEYPGITTVGEVGADDSLGVMAEYTNGGDKLHTAYSFDLLSEACSAPHFHQTMSNFEQRVTDGWACWAISNHDVVRVATRWGGAQATPAALKLYAAMQLSLRGSPCIYQGDELGLPEAELSFEQLQDPYGITMWPAFKGRDGCRTPMPWSAAAPQAGFSSASKSWLPVAAPHLALAADVQQRQSDSVLAHYRTFLKWRKTQPALIDGDISMLPVDEQVLAFIRQQDGKQLLCAFNLSASAARYALPAGTGALAACDGHGFSAAGISSTQLDLAAWGACFAWID